MHSRLKLVLTSGAAGAALLAASSANASGYYLSLFGGWSTMEDEFSVVTTTTSSTSTKTSFASFYRPNPQCYYGLFGASVLGDVCTTYGASTTSGSRSTVFGSSNSLDDGWVLGAALGIDFDNNWRAELEVAYRSHDLEGRAAAAYVRYYYTRTSFGYGTFYNYYVNGTGATTVDQGYGSPFYSGFTSGTGTTTIAGTVAAKADGDLEAWSFMVNVWYDFDMGDSPLHPFVGGGIGFTHATLDYNLRAGTGIPNSYSLFGTGGYAYAGNGEESDWGFAYQLGAGVGYDLGNGVMLSAQYRYFNSGGLDLSPGGQIEVDLESHNFLVGISFPIGGGM